MLRVSIGCITIAGIIAFSVAQSSASEDAILNAIRSGAVKLGTEVPIPPEEDAASSLGGEAAVNPVTQVTKAQQRLIVDKLFPLAEAKWPFNLTFVCWENPTDDNKEGRLWVHDAVMNSWAKYADIRFLGTDTATGDWQKCTPATVGIHILVDEQGPHTKGLGKFLDGKKDGMVLNFTFASWSPSCQSQREFCIKGIAIHEFGHAIGIAHEQNRPDAPGECGLRRQGTDGNVLALTPYDPNSVMNYCNEKYNNDAKLSELDIKGAQSFYGMPH